jgi:folate-dependent phosphoribosylglycinamide formyltransferase PurN
MSVLLLAKPSDATNVVYHALASDFPGLEVVLESAGSRWEMLRGRYRRLGVRPAVGQAVFVALAVPLLRRRAQARIHAILDEHGLDASPILTRVHRVESVNSEAARALLRDLAPRVVVVFGTRVIGKATLAASAAPFINMHAGITPRYRGVHGGYWALAEGRPDLVGTTIHLVDEGIDTGAVLEQVRFTPALSDNFASYPYLHVAAGLPALRRAVRAALEGRLGTVAARGGPSRLRYHPTVFEYLSGGVP